MRTQSDGPVGPLSSAREVAARVAVELDPERDPEPILAVRLGFQEGMFGGMTRLHVPRQVKAPFADPMTLINIGVARLRRLSPTTHYQAMLRDSAFEVRHFACTALGDTADPAALEFLEAALRDPQRKVRANAADTVRRLHNAEVLRTDGSVDATLIRGLADDDHDVAVACARALVVAGRQDEIRAALPSLARRRQRRIEPALTGRIPPRLGAIWPGDRTT